MTTRMTVKFTDVYGGIEHERTKQIDVNEPPPGEVEDGEAYDSWAYDEIFPHAGGSTAGMEARPYFAAEIIEAPGWPHLAGMEFSWDADLMGHVGGE